MNKFREMDKKKKITISVIVILLLLIGSAIAIYGVSTLKNNDGKAKVENDINLSENEENKAKDLKAEMDEKLKNAKTEEEKEAIKKEYAKKIEKATDGKVSGSSNGEVETSKPQAKPSKPSTGGTTGENTSKPTESSKPQHTHSFSIPITKTVTKYRTEEVDKYYYNGKYYDDYDVAMQQQYNDVLNDISGGSVSPVTVEEQVPYTVEEVVGYKCSCGATK